MVHGAMDRAAGFVKVGRHLTDLDVVRYDRRGYGRSQGAGISTTFATQAYDLLAVVGETPAVLVGHSVGGAIAVLAAERRPDLFPAVFAFEAPTPWASWYPTRRAVPAADTASDEQVRAEVDRFMVAVIGAPRWDALASATREQRYGDGRALLVDLAITSRSRDGRRRTFDPTSLRQPVVAAHGSESHDRHVRSARELADGAPNGELHVVEGASHTAPDSHPAEVAALIRHTVDLASW